MRIKPDGAGLGVWDAATLPSKCRVHLVEQSQGASRGAFSGQSPKAHLGFVLRVAGGGKLVHQLVHADPACTGHPPQPHLPDPWKLERHRCRYS